MGAKTAMLAHADGAVAYLVQGWAACDARRAADLASASAWERISHRDKGGADGTDPAATKATSGVLTG